MRWFPRGVFLAIAVASAVLPAPGFSFASGARSGIAWQVASTDAEVDRAFASARRQGKPLFLYWGAVWCPPCNQVKATLFSRSDFVERSRSFVPVYVDGDKAGAQKVAARFKVTGYPTMVLFKPDGTEVTRLPGEVDPQRYLLALSAGLNAQVPVRELARRALAGTELNEEQWRLLAFYSWDTDEQQIFRTEQLATKLNALAGAAPVGAVRDRLALKAAATRAHADPPAADAAARTADLRLVERLLADANSAAAQRDLLSMEAASLMAYLGEDGNARSHLAAQFDAALADALASAPSRADALDVLDARISIWKAMSNSGSLPAERQQFVRAEVLRIVSQTTDRYERQAVVPSAAQVLSSSGLMDDSDRLLKSELPRAIAPYYHMLGLASNAKKRGETRDALKWYERAWRKSEGAATRLQWGASYVRELVSLTPDDTTHIAAAAKEVISEVEPKGETFYERNQRSLVRMATTLEKWKAENAGRVEVVSGLKKQLLQKCAHLPKGDGRSNCEGVFASDRASRS